MQASKGHRFDVHRVNTESRGRAHVNGVAGTFADALSKRTVQGAASAQVDFFGAAGKLLVASVSYGP